MVFEEKSLFGSFSLGEQLQNYMKNHKRSIGAIVIAELWFHLAGLGRPARLQLLCASSPESDC